VALPDPVAVYADDTLRQVANVFAEHAITAAPVVTRRDPAVLVGVIRLSDLLQARLMDLTEEQHREVHLRPVPVRRTRLRRTALRPAPPPDPTARPRSADRPPVRPTP
jgi:CBS domain-containing protein